MAIKPRTKVFSKGTLITPAQKINNDLVIEGGKIKEIRKTGILKKGEEVIDCKGLFVGPGLVDIHVHGGAGNDFNSMEAKEIADGAQFHLLQGTTSLAPSSISVPFDQLDKTIEATKLAVKNGCQNIIGYHIEGIYLNQEYRGGHLSEYVHNPNPAEYEPIIEKYGDFITEWTLAPELPGAIELITACKQAGIITSAGHTGANYGQMKRAMEAGLSHSTHFACVMGNLRFEALQKTTGKGFAPGVLETVLLEEKITTEVIADGFHLHKAIIELVLKCKGINKVALISDAMKGVGLPDGEYFIGGQDCIVKNGIAIIKARPEVIASSVTTLVGMLCHAVNDFNLSLNHAWTMATLTPATIVGIDRQKGSLSAGKDADILILDKDLNIRDIYIKGEKV